MKDHEIRELVNQLRDIAIEYHGTQQLRERIARAVRAAILQAQSDDDGEPTDDERIMAIEGILNCDRCGDEGWIVGEMGITRCACGQAGNFRENANSSTNNCREIPETSTKAPAIPDGYVMVPNEPTEEMLQASYREAAVYSPTAYRAMLAAAPQPQNAPQNIPEIIPNELIAAVNRLFDSNGSRGCYNAIKCYDAHIEVERLLAVALQEVK
ncbi:hypothetical protein [Klebsiella quasipneumoniae]|uniref:hypothetical protein n=1 Tax=Klebsiella quasipneumoniae TaxID=1463165 RepID=UPI003004F35B